MTEQQKIMIDKLVEGLDPNNPNTIALRDAAIARPVPAIEKPLGLRRPKSQATQIVLIENPGAFDNWTNNMRGREWG